jgi:tetratricopeptide (TPR) repeat protein
MPDFPHMTYRTAFLMGEGFKINDVRFSVDQSSVDDWCNVSLSEDQDESVGALQVELPKRLVAGKHPQCFYCGLRTHQPTECPTRHLQDLDYDIWDRMARLDFDSMNEGFTAIDKYLAGEPEEGLAGLVNSEGIDGLLVRAIFQINAPVQHRMAMAVFRSTGKDYPKGLSQQGPMQNELVANALQNLHAGEVLQTDRLLSQAVLKAPRSYQPRTLQGFAALEKGDPARAQVIWKEAEGQCTSPLQQSMHLFLQARSLEMQGKLQSASSLYKQVLNFTPRWLDAVYRQGVCLVKMGFAEQAMSFFEDLIDKDAHMFNRALIDPELERGHLHMLTALYGRWTAAENLAQEEKRNLEELRKEVGKWFPEDHAFHEEAQDRISDLLRLGEIKNYVAFHRLAHGRKVLSKDLQLRVEEESRKLKNRFESFMERLKVIRDEAAWFPFPKILLEFNKDFNYCAKNLNWAMRQHFQVADNFRRANAMAEELSDKLKDLESRLKTLKVVRDATLFVLVMGKTFFWLEILGLILSLVLLPVTIFYGQKMGYDWASGLVVRQKWEIQKGLIIILSILALALAALRTAIVFEKKKEKLFKKMEQQGAG